MQFELVENPGPQMGSGAGISAAQIVGDSGAEAVVAGNFGPNASQALGAGGVRMFQASGMSVREAAQAAAAGQLPEVGGPTTAAHTGVGGQMPGGALPACARWRDGPMAAAWAVHGGGMGVAWRRHGLRAWARPGNGRRPVSAGPVGSADGAGDDGPDGGPMACLGRWGRCRRCRRRRR